ncbi:hypothetical protein [Hungatella effluvii]|uniref:hypothetical protein n=1 Tax=Hungatella effluvii TaxID=1096246 RepID=UPI002A826317|nr:hypothetical protein [Hungatella effluvii]
MCKENKEMEFYRAILDDILKEYGGEAFVCGRYSYIFRLPISSVVGMYRYYNDFCMDQGLTELISVYCNIFHDIQSRLAYEFAKTF